MEALVEMLRPKLLEQQVRAVADKDLENKAISWRYRMLLYVELYRLTNSEHFFIGLEALLTSNRKSLDKNTGIILQSRSKWTTAAAEALSRLALEWVLDQSAEIDVRLSFIDGIGYNTLESYIKNLEPKKREINTRILGQLFLKSRGYCYPQLDLLNKFSPIAASVFAYQGLEISADISFRECIQNQINTLRMTPRPPSDVFQHWLSDERKLED